ncbi:MAG: hypothetical protein IKI72_05620 [Bacteroidales bacterium]|nr:hypothetical protein [Bacteroidales bacterium]
MKKLFSTIAIVMCALMLNAQPQGAPQGQGQRQGQRGGFNSEERMKAQVDTLAKVLTLTADQKTKVTAAYTEASTKQTALRGQMQQGGDRTAMQAEMTKIQTARDEAIKKVLNADQVKKFDEYQKAQAERRAQFGQRGQGGQFGQRNLGGQGAPRQAQ